MEHNKIAIIDLQLGEIVLQVADANGHDSVATINVLERHGLPTALEFVQPLLCILKSDKDSPLRTLNTFEIQALFTENMRRQEIIINELESRLKAGEVVSIRTGTPSALWAHYRARVKSAKDRECNPSPSRVNRTREDAITELIEAKEKIIVYEKALSAAADMVNMSFEDYVINLLQSA